MADVYLSSEEKEVQVSQDVTQPAPENRTQEAHTHNPLSSFCYNPHNISFDTQDKDEKIVLFLRQHPIVNIPWLIIAAILIVSPLVLTWFPLISFLPARFQLVAIMFWYLIVSAFVIESVLSWFFNVYMVTNKRIVDVDFVNLIYREVSTAEIDKIQDTGQRVGGVVRSLFDYGDVVVQTASAVPEFDFEAVPHPTKVVNVIEDMQDEIKKNTK